QAWVMEKRDDARRFSASLSAQALEGFRGLPLQEIRREVAPGRRSASIGPPARDDDGVLVLESSAKVTLDHPTTIRGARLEQVDAHRERSREESGDIALEHGPVTFGDETPGSEPELAHFDAGLSELALLHQPYSYTRQPPCFTPEGGLRPASPPCRPI